MKKDIIEEHFNNMPEHEPSLNFTSNLMQMIEQEVVKAEKREKRRGVIALIAALVGIVGAGAYFIITSITEAPELPAIQMDWIKDISNYQLPILIGVMILLLLMGDQWLRRRFINKIADK